MQHRKLDTDTLGGLVVSMVGILVASFFLRFPPGLIGEAVALTQNHLTILGFFIV